MLELRRDSTERGIAAFDYATAFSRNLGLVTLDEQYRLRHCRVGIVGAGGVGGSHALALARLGIGAFRIIDPDTFNIVNFNRQAGAMASTVCKPKAQVVGKMVRDINPTAEVETCSAPLSERNVLPFLDGVDVVADGLDFFAVDARITLYRACREAKIPVITSGPMGMSATMHIFAPGGMDFEKYFDLRPDMAYLDKLIAFLVGLSPRMSQRPYMDMGFSNIKEQYGPSLGAACMICSGVLAVEALRVLLERPGLKPAPYYYQFDAYRRRLYRGYLRWGNRHPVQRLKRWMAKRQLTQIVQGIEPAATRPDRPRFPSHLPRPA